MTQMFETTGFAVALTGGIDQSQIAQLVERVRIGTGVRLQKQFFKGNGDVFGKASAGKTTGGDGVAVPGLGSPLRGC